MSRKNTLLILTIICAVFVLAMSACQLGQTQPKLEWDPSKEVQLIVVSDSSQFPGILPTYQDERMENYIPKVFYLAMGESFGWSMFMKMVLPLAS